MSAKSSNTNKKKTNKRRRISKHVIEAKKKAAALKAEEQGGQTSSENGAEGTPTTKSNSRSEKVHASHALAYLNAYIASKNESSDETVNWKFSKNTQTWLIKHMYDADIISKSTFTLLLQYLQGLQGKTKSRVLEEASKWVLQYKEHEAQLEGQGAQRSVEDDEDKARRKVYKRARQIVQLLQ